MGGGTIGTVAGGVLGGVGGSFIGQPMLGASLGMAVGGGIGSLLDQPSLPTPPKAPDPADDAVRNARIMERRKQLGLQGRMSTFLTTAQGDQAPAQSSASTTTLLGG